MKLLFPSCLLRAAVAAVVLIADTSHTNAFVPPPLVGSRAGAGAAGAIATAGAGAATYLLARSSDGRKSSRTDDGSDGDGGDDDDNALRFVYNEWKLIHGKQGEAFDARRFDNFKGNYRALTDANVKARTEADQWGRPPPPWMTLNGYGDYSVEEYEALLLERAGDGGTTTTTTTTTSYAPSYPYPTANGVVEERQDQYGRPIRPTQVVQPPQLQQQQQQPRGTQVIQQAQQQQQPRGTQVIASSTGPSGTSPLNGYSYDYSNMMNAGGRGAGIGGQGQQGGEYQDQFGRTIRPTQFPQSGPNNGNDEFAKYYNARATQVVQGGSDSSMRGTQVVVRQGPADASGPSTPPSPSSLAPPGGTLVVKRNSDDEGRGTVVLQRKNDRDGAADEEGTDMAGGEGTQVIQTASGPSTSSSYGTQVLTSSGPNGSYSYSGGGGSGNGGFGGGAAYGTQVIESDSATRSSDANYNYGTQVVQTGSNYPSPEVTATSGTLIIPKKTNPGATTEINVGQGYDDDEDDDDDWEGGEVVGGRGTMVIKRQIIEQRPSMNLFSLLMGSDGKKEDENTAMRGTLNIKGEPINDSSSTGQVVTPASNSTSKSLFEFFGSITQKIDGNINNGSSSSIRNGGTTEIAGTQPILPRDKTDVDDTSEKADEKLGLFSLFSGKRKGDNSRSVRGTIIIQKDGENVKKAGEDKSRRTVLIPKKEKAEGVPSILSFFGGAKKVTEEEAARNPNARPTLIIKKPARKKKPLWSPFSAVDAAPLVESPTAPVNKQNFLSKVMAPKPNENLQANKTIFLAKVRCE